MLQVIKALLFWRAKATRPQRKGLLLNPIEVFGPDYECPALWRKARELKHAERTAARLSVVKMDPVVELSQSLKAAGIHPSQLAPTIAGEATIAPPNAATTVITPQRQPGPIIRWLDRTLSKLFDLVPRRSWKDKRKD